MKWRNRLWPFGLCSFTVFNFSLLWALANNKNSGEPNGSAGRLVGSRLLAESVLSIVTDSDVVVLSFDR